MVRVEVDDRHARELAAQLALLTHADRGEPGNEVRLMSLHGAKGLEFRAVFIVGCEDGNLPHEHSIAEGMTPASFRQAWVVCDTVEAAIKAMQGADDMPHLQHDRR